MSSCSSSSCHFRLRGELRLFQPFAHQDCVVALSRPRFKTRYTTVSTKVAQKRVKAYATMPKGSLENTQ